MKLNPNHKLDKAASRDSSRPVLTSVYLDTSDPEAPVAVATDSYVLAVVPVEVGPEDTSGLVPVEALKAAAKVKHGAELVANGSVELSTPAGSSTWARPEGQFPDWRKLTPVRKADGAEEPVVYRIAFSAELLWNLAQAIGAGGKGHDASPVVLELGANPLRPIRVLGADGAHGILMPIRSDRATGPVTPIEQVPTA